MRKRSLARPPPCWAEREAGGLRHDARGQARSGGVDADSRPKVAPRLHRHHDLFERTVARALAEPLIVHSICRAPPILTPASELATAMPGRCGSARSRWPCRVRHLLRRVLMNSPYTARDAVAHGVGDVDGAGALARSRPRRRGPEVHVRAVAVFGRNSMSPHRLRAKRTACACSSTCSRVMQLLLHVGSRWR